MKILFKQSPQYRLPWWAGVCWFNYESRDVIAGPIPLNLLLRLVRAFWLWLKRPIRYFDAAHEAEYWRRIPRRGRLTWMRLDCPHCGMSHTMDMVEDEE